MLSYFQGHRPFAKLCATRRHRGASKGSRRVVVRGALARHGVREALALDGPCHRDRFYPLPRSYDQSARAVDEPISSSRATLLIDRRTLSYAIFMFVLCVCVHACTLSLLQSLSLSFSLSFAPLSLSLFLTPLSLSLSLKFIHVFRPEGEVQSCSSRSTTPARCSASSRAAPRSKLDSRFALPRSGGDSAPPTSVAASREYGWPNRMLRC